MTQGHGVVLITGASSGIGMATALYMAERGHRVVGTSRAKERLAGLEAEAARRDLPVFGVELDINSEAALAETLAAIVKEHGPVGVLVNNAGYGLFGPVQTLSADELRTQFETNVFAVARLIRAVLPGMIEQGGGTIVNVSSILGRIGAPFHGAYASSKFALEGLTESLRTEVWPLGVRVALVEPGLIRTAFPENQLMAADIESDDGAPYDRYVRRYRSRVRGAFERGADPVRVAKAIHGIVRSRRPRLRYPVGPDSRLGSLGARLLPEGVFLGLLGWAVRRGPRR